ncbi:leucine-rich repeat domain-containing protein, partial [bacterium]|nr:leucine-rich repeat domain-containing protein [bacterium]
MKKSILIFLFALLNVFIARAYGFEVNGIYYNIISGTDQVEVTSGSVKYSGSVVIPATVMYNGDTYRVTSIGNYAFSNCTGLTSVTIGESVTTIGTQAFWNCTGLTSVTIPGRVTTIESHAFYSCTGLTSVTIGESVTSIGASAFSNCTGLISVTIGESVTTIGTQAFFGSDSISSPLYNSKIFAYLPKNYSGEYAIPSGIQSIAPTAFYRCNGLRSVTIPESVTTIGDLAFYETGLVKVTSLAQTPPHFIGNSDDGYSFEGFTYALGTLYVPQGCKSTYESAEGWHKFSKIEEIEEAGPTYMVTVLANDASMGTVSGGNTYASGAEAILTAIPNAGYHFVKWDDENTDNPRMLTVTADITLTAIFAENIPDTYTVTVLANDASMGTVSGGKTYASGAEATLTAVPNAGYHFVQWDDENTDNPRTLTVTADITLTAIFAENIPDTYTVTALANDAAMGMVSGGNTYASGAEAILTAIPNAGYHFVKWDDENTDNP